MRGLLVIEPMYHQIVAGNKTQTRRSGGLECVNGGKEIIANPNDWECGLYNVDCNWVKFYNRELNYSAHCQPRYRIGEVLYLKEPYYAEKFTEERKTHYKYDGPNISVLKWQNKLFMPASVARAYVRITGIKCERLLDISDEDCIAEGIEKGYSGDTPFGYIDYLMHAGYGYDYIDNTPKESFISLYKLANKLAKVGSVPPHGSLPTPPDIDNIWVWAYTFEIDYNLPF